MKLQEIEVKFVYDDKETIISLLADDFKKYKTIELHDKYFSHKRKSMSDTNCLIRLRSQNGKIELTYKEKNNEENKITNRTELSSFVDDAETMEIILGKLGCKYIKENLSTREIWKNKKVEVTFIEFSKPAKLKFLEIESQNIEEVKNVINKINKYGRVAGEEIFKIFDKQ